MMRDRDPMVALLLELLGGFFGFLGIGWIYAGRTTLGVIVFAGYWVLDWVIGLTLAVVTFGAWCCIWPAQNLLFGALSGYLVYRWLERHP